MMPVVLWDVTSCGFDSHLNKWNILLFLSLLSVARRGVELRKNWKAGSSAYPTMRGIQLDTKKNIA